MAESHDNQVPAKKGAYTLGQQGILCYFPIEDSGPLKPFLALILMRHANGEITASIDERWPPLQGLD